MAGPREKKVTRKIADKTKKTSSITKEGTQRSRSKEDGPGKSKSSRGKNTGSVARNHTAGIPKADKTKPTGRGTEISNKTLAKRTKTDLKTTLRERKKDETSTAKKKATKKAAKKSLVKSIAKKIPGVGLAVEIIDAVTTRRKGGKKGRSNVKKKTGSVTTPRKGRKMGRSNVKRKK